MTASNGYTGGTTVNAGTLLAANTASLPGYTAARSIVVNAGATLALTAGTNAGEFSLTGGAAAGGVDTVLLSGNVYFAPGANLGINVNSPENVAYGTSIANINGPLGFVKLGTGILSLTGNNTYTNGTQVNGGVLIATSTSSLGFSGGGAPSTLGPAYLTSGQISVNNPGTTLAVQAGLSTGEFKPSDVSNVLSNVTFGAGTVFGIQVVSGESFNYGSSIPDGNPAPAGMGFLKLGAGTLTLNAASSYAGPTTISAGVLLAAAGQALGTGTAIQLGDANTGASPAQLFIGGGNTFSQNITVNAINATLGSADDSNSAFGGNVTLNSSLTISSQSVSPGNALTFAGNILHGSGTNSVTLTGPGNVIFLGNATYQGATTINGGNLTVGATGSLPSTTTLNINNASTVKLDNPAQTLAVLNGSSASTLNLFNESGTMLTVGAGSFAGSINDGGNAASLTKTTTGILYLTGANTYYGSTTVTAGALLYGSMSSVSTVAQNNSITVSTSGAVGLESGGLPSLLPYLTSASNGTLVVTPATSADAVNLAAIRSAWHLGQRDVYGSSDAQRHELSPGWRRRLADLRPVIDGQPGPDR